MTEALPVLPDNAQRYLEAILAGDRATASRVAHRFVDDGESVIRLYQGVIQPALYRVGTLWEHNRISVAAEHLATAISEGVMNEFFGEIISSTRTGMTALIASVQYELHQVGAKMVSDLFEMHGWDALYLGADTPVDELLRMARERPAHVIGLSLSVYFHLPELEGMLDRIHTEYPALPILIGGQGLIHVGERIAAERDRVFYFPGLTALDRYIAEFN